MNQLICHAIHIKKLVSLTYEGVTRIVEPHAYGLCSEGNEILRCYSVEENRSSILYQDWNLLPMSKVEKLTMLENGFLSARPGYVKDDKPINIIYEQL